MLCTRATTSFSPALLLTLIALGLLCCPGCAPRQIGATQDALYASGRADFTIRVAPPLSLSATGAFNTSVASDVNIAPWGRFHYAVFTDSDDGPVQHHAHAAICELNKLSWRWEKETWSLPEAFFYAKEKKGGKYWTIQMLPVSAKKDWFSALWRENGRETPEFWIAKRWSSTPEDEIRIVAEYREPAPECMLERLREAEAQPMGAPSLKGKTLLRNCDQAVEAFSRRADAVFALDTMNKTAPEGVPATTQTARPKNAPNMPKLIGRAELLDRGGDEYRP